MKVEGEMLAPSEGTAASKRVVVVRLLRLS
jgi:hypothetical protein